MTAVGEVVRTNLENGWPLGTSYNGTISITKNPGSGPLRRLGARSGEYYRDELGSATSPELRSQHSKPCRTRTTEISGTELQA